MENLLVTGYAAEGKSLARHEGKVIFMENAVPGDIVTVRLTKNKKDWAEGQVIADNQAFLRKESSHSVRILGFVADVSGRCFPMRNNWNTSRIRFSKASNE